MRERICNIVLVLWVSAMVTAGAQPLELTVVVPSTPSPYLEDWISGREVVLVTISNPRLQPVEGVLQVRLYLDGQLQAETRVEELIPVVIPPGNTTFYAQDFLLLEAIEFYGESRTNVERSGRLPEGSYQFCVRLLDAQTFEPLTAVSQYCQNFRIIVYTPPFLIAPSHQDTISSLLDLIFQWSPVVPAYPSPIRYRLQVFEVQEGQDPMVAYRTNPPVIDYEVGDRLSVVYQLEMGLLQPNRQYVWTVQVVDINGRPLFSPDGRTEPFVFVYAPDQPSGKKEDSTNEEPLTTFVRIHTIRVGLFNVILSDTVECSEGGCTLSGSGTIFVPFLQDSIRVRFHGVDVVVTDTPGVVRAVAGVVEALGSWILPIFPPYPEFYVELIRWRFLPDRALVDGTVFFDGTQNWGLACFVPQEIPFDGNPIQPDQLGLTLPVPSAWECSGEELGLGDCFWFAFDTLSVRRWWNGTQIEVEATLAGTVTVPCWSVGTDPVSIRLWAEVRPGSIDMLATVRTSVQNAKVAGLPIWISVDSLVFDGSALRNHPDFPPPTLCHSVGWSDPLWKGIWLPGAIVRVQIGQDTVEWDVYDVVLEDGGGQLLVSLRVDTDFPEGKTISFAGFDVRLDSATLWLCQNAIERFTAQGRLRLPAVLQKPVEWAALDSLYVRLEGQDYGGWFDWIGTLDLFGAIRLGFPPSEPIAVLQLRNGRIVKASGNRGYVEFTIIDLQAPPDDPMASARLTGLRIWNDGRVQLGDGQGWMTLGAWSRLQVGGLVIQVQEVGVGYESGHWWVGLSGGFEIAAASGLSTGANGMRVRRLRIFDDGRMVSDAAFVRFAVSDALTISGMLQWGNIDYGSVIAQGMTGRLSGRFDCLGGVQAAVDFAFGHTVQQTPFRFWYLNGQLAVPGGLPIVPGAFHLVGGVLGAGWHVRMNDYTASLITSSGFASPPPIVPDQNVDLLLRGGLLFADPSLQMYLFRLTSSVALGHSFQINLAGDLNVLPAVNLASGTLSAQYWYNDETPIISMGGSATVNLLDLQRFTAGFHSTFTLTDPCLTIGPLSHRWNFVDMDESFGTNLLGVDVVARGYVDLSNLMLRLCPTAGQFVGNLQGTGVAGAVLHVAGVGHVPFHVGFDLQSQMCLRYSVLMQNREAGFWARAKVGAFLDVASNADYSGWWSWGWKGTQAWDHIGTHPPVSLSRHWAHCRGNKCASGSIRLTLNGIFEGELTVPKVQTTIGGKHIEFPNWLNTRPAIRYGSYAAAQVGEHQWAKKGGNNATMVAQAQQWTCTQFSDEAEAWADQNRAQQPPPPFIRSTEPLSGTEAVDPASPEVQIVFGAPIATHCSPSSTYARCWYVDRSSLSFVLQQLDDERSSVQRVWTVGVTIRPEDTVVIVPKQSMGSTMVEAVLLPDRWYRLIVSGQLRSPDPAVSVSGRDTIWFRTAPRYRNAVLQVGIPAANLWQRGTVGELIGELVIAQSMDQIQIQGWGRALWSMMQPGRDWYLEVRNIRTGQQYQWRGRFHRPFLDSSSVRVLGVWIGTVFALDTVYFQPFVSENSDWMDGNERGLILAPGVYEFRIRKVQGGNRPASVQAVLDGLPDPILRWRIRKLLSHSLSTHLSLRMSWERPVDFDHPTGFIRITNISTTPLYPGVPLALRVQTLIAEKSSTSESPEEQKTMNTFETEAVIPVSLPFALQPGQSMVIPISLGVSVASLEDQSLSYEVQGVRVRLVSQRPEFQIDGVLCIMAGKPTSDPCTLQDNPSDPRGQPSDY